MTDHQRAIDEAERQEQLAATFAAWHETRNTPTSPENHDGETYEEEHN